VLAGGRGERGAAEVARRRVAVLGVLGERPPDHRVEFARHSRALGGRGGCSCRCALIVAGTVLRRNGGLAAQRREQHAPERVDVRARVARLAAQVLGRHVVDRADPRAALREARVGALQAAEAEVAEIGVGTRQQDVRRLDVAVHEPGGVRGVQARRDLRDDVGRVRALEPSPLEQLVQVRPST
jgi:hypothetical protein